jgi:hypothetical protein
MRVISTTDISREGNDCYIYESVSLVEQFDLYSVISFYKVYGWSEHEEVCVLKHTTNFEEAKNAYICHGGVYKEYDPDDVYF